MITLPGELKIELKDSLTQCKENKMMSEVEAIVLREGKIVLRVETIAWKEKIMMSLSSKTMLKGGTSMFMVRAIVPKEAPIK